MLISKLLEKGIKKEDVLYYYEYEAMMRNLIDFEEDGFSAKQIERGIRSIIGKLKGKKSTDIQAYRFDKDIYSSAEAKEWLKDNDIKYILFDENDLNGLSDIKENVKTQFKALMDESIRREVFNGKDHIVIPVILMVEGVHNEVLYSADELGKFPEAWNGRPVPVWHPEIDGVKVSANDPEVLEQWSVGFLFNTHYADGKLKSEAWLEIDKVAKIGPEVLAMLINNQMIEVSTGLFVDELKEQGFWQGEKYSCVAFNYRPDHLALLPGGKGACSIDDGAGMPRLNEENPKKDNKTGGKQIQLSGEVKVPVGKFVDTFMCALKEVCTLNFNSNKEGDLGMDRKEQVEALIANEKLAWSEDDREFLLKAEDAQFEKIVSSATVAAEEKANAKPAVNKKDPEVNKTEKTPEKKELEEKKDEIKENDSKKEAAIAPTFEELLAKAKPELRESIERGIKDQEDKKDTIVKALLENERCTYSEEELKAKTIDELEKLAKLSQVEVNFSGISTGPKANADDGKIEPTPALDFSKK